MTSNPYLTKAEAEATSVFGWLKAQVINVFQDHKIAASVIAICAFVAGCVIH